MELKKWNKSIIAWTGKYKYALGILLVGLLLMMIPSRSDLPPETTEKTGDSILQTLDLSSELSELLSHVQGAGHVKVMLSVSEGEKTLYQSDNNLTQSDTNTSSKSQTILITDSERNQTGLVHQKNPPVYRGAVVLAQGADNPTVRLAIVDAVSKATGLGADKIAVLKMK